MKIQIQNKFILWWSTIFTSWEEIDIFKIKVSLGLTERDFFMQNKGGLSEQLNTFKEAI